MRYTLEIIALSVCEIVHRIDIPLASCTVVRMGGDDAVDDRITEVHVRVGHINLGTEHHLAILYLAALHGFEQAQVFLDRTVAIRRSHTGFGRRTFLLGYLLGRLLIHVGLTLLDETDGEVVELLEVVGSVIDIAPTETQPADVTLDGFYIFGVLFGRVGVVETQVADAVVFLCDTEVHANSLDVADVQVAVRLRRKTRLDTSVIHSLCEVFFYDLLNKIETFFLLFHYLLV